MAKDDPAKLSDLIASLLARSNPLQPPPSRVENAVGNYLDNLLRAANQSGAGTRSLWEMAQRPSSNPTTLGGLFGLATPVPQATGNAARQTSLPPPRVAPPKQRHVFYSFHYADVFRVNHVRNSGKIREGDKGLRPRDRSLWESVRRTDPANLRRVINAGLQSTSVTCVLAGYATWSREWVRYEIAKSLQRGNGLLTVYIDGCKCPHDGYGIRGFNPLDVMALGWDQRIYEFRDDGWHLYSKVQNRIGVWPKWLARPSVNHVMPLSTGARAYDWIADSGYHNLIRWTCDAARSAGR